MDELDRELGALADSLRPDHQPALDTLVARSVRRRRRTAVVASALAVVAVTGTAVALAGGDRTTVTPPVATSAPTPTPTAMPERPVGCGNDRINGIIDYINFVKVNGLVMASADTYGIPVTVRDGDLGQATDRVTCSLQQDANSTGTTERMDDGTASFLPTGTTVSEVQGFDPRCRVAAVQDGKLVAFLASLPDAKTHKVAPCAVMPGLAPDAPRTAPGDYRSAPAAFQNRPELPDCGSALHPFATPRGDLTATVACFRAADAAGRQAEMRIAYTSDIAHDGTTYRVLRVDKGRVEMWESRFASGLGSAVRWGWFTCARVNASGYAEGCTELTG